MVHKMWKPLLTVGVSLFVCATVARADVDVFVSVTWDGDKPAPFHLEALQELQDVFPEITISHFVSPINFVGADTTVKAYLASHVKNKANVGTLFGGWKDIVQKAKVVYRSTPSLYGRNKKNDDCGSLCGADVPVTVYNDKELDKIIKVSKEMMEAEGYSTSKAMKTVGWQMSDRLATSALQAGYVIDFSAVPQKLLQSELDLLPIMSWVRQSWREKDPMFAWFRIGSGPFLIEAGSPLADLDYITGKELAATIIKAWDHKNGESNVLHLSLNAQTLKYQTPKIRAALAQLRALKGDPQWHPNYLSLEDLENRARQLALGQNSPTERIRTTETL